MCEGGDRYIVGVAAPIISEGDVSGCVIFLWCDGMALPGDTEHKLAQTIAGFLSRQMEG